MVLRCVLYVARRHVSGKARFLPLALRRCVQAADFPSRVQLELEWRVIRHGRSIARRFPQRGRAHFQQDALPGTQVPQFLFPDRPAAR